MKSTMVVDDVEDQKLRSDFNDLKQSFMQLVKRDQLQRAERAQSTERAQMYFEHQWMCKL